MNRHVALFLTSFLQVSLVTGNVTAITYANFFLIAIYGFLISYVWTYNVKRVAIGGGLDRLIYSLGAMCGSVFGVLASKMIISWL